MKKHAKTGREGFTLVELLVVIVIIGLLAAMLVPGLSGAFRAAEKRRAMGQLDDLAGALKSYFAEYNEFPGGWSEDVAYGKSKKNKEIIDPLLNRGTDAGKNKTTGVNYKGRIFIELESGAQESYDQKGELLDPWGEPYEILLDMNFDDKIASGTGSSQTKDIKAKVAVQSSGPDKTFGTKDDLRTW